MAETYTIADLCALDNSALDKMAAELRGWRLEEDEYPPELAPMRKGKTVPVWIDSNGRFTGYAPVSMAGYLTKWTPTTNRNQSGELLSHAESKGVMFDVAFGHYAPDERHPHIEAYWPVYNEATWRNENKWLCHIPGNDARAETIAFCAAMLAMAGRLTEGK